MRKVRGKVQYLIRWKGYAAADNTWEPADSIMDSKLILDFERRQGKAPSASTKRKRAPAATCCDIWGRQQLACIEDGRTLFAPA